MKTTGYYDAQFLEKIDLDLHTESSQGNVAGKIAGNLYSQETKLMELYTKLGNATGTARDSIESEISKADVSYKRSLRMFEMFQQLVKNSHEMMQRIIANMALR